MAYLVALGLTVAFVTFQLIAPSGFPSGSIIPTLLAQFGTLLIAFGVIGRIWSIIYIADRKNSELVIAGPYSMTRNPVYLFSLCTIIGICLVFGNPLATVIFTPLAYLVFRYTAKRKALYLSHMFGKQYAEYARRTPGSLLISPMHAAAQARGFNLMADADNVLGNYQGTIFAGPRSWASDNEAALVGYIRAYHTALDWLHDPVNKTEAVAMLRTNMPNIPEAFDDKTYEILLHPKKGPNRTGDLDIKGVKTVLAMRSEYGESPKTLTDVEY